MPLADCSPAGNKSASRPSGHNVAARHPWPYDWGLAEAYTIAPGLLQRISQGHTPTPTFLSADQRLFSHPKTQPCKSTSGGP